MTPDALITRAKREEDTYGQKELPAMLRAGAEAMRECERLRAGLKHIAEYDDPYEPCGWAINTARAYLTKGTTA